MRTFSRYLLESPLDELPTAVEGTHPHIIFDSYKDEKKRTAERFKDNPTPYRGHETHNRFLSTRVYEDPDSGVATTIKMVHKTPGSTIDMTNPKETVGVAQVGVSVNDNIDDVSKLGSRFQMPGDIMKKISVASGHLHNFIGERNPHTIEYRTQDPKRHALYQHMARLYPHIKFLNLNEVIPVKRKPKPVAIPESYSVNTNYWNTANINKFILESPLDELPAPVEGPHPHETENDHFVNAREAAWNMKWDTKGTPITFDSHHTYHDPDTRISTGIRMTHTNPGWTGKPDKTAGVAHVHIGISGFTDPGFQMPGAVMAKIKSGINHVGHFINNYTPRGLHTIEYDTTDPKRDSLYKYIGEKYPHITFRNISKLIPVKRKPKKALTDSVNTNYWNTRNINKFILESPLDELPTAVEGTHPHQTEDTYEDQKRTAAWHMKQAPHEAPIGFRSDHTYHDPSTGVATQIKMNHLTPGWGGDRHPSTGVATVEVSAGGQWGDSSQNGSNFQMPGDIMGKIKSSREHIHDFITKYKPHTIEYDTSDPKRHMLYQHIARQYPRILFRNTGELKPVKRKPRKAVAVSESYTQKQMATANQTSRSSGAIGKKAITPAYVKTITSKKHKILDFGSGRDAAHTKVLRKTGRRVTAHEFGANVNQNHDPKALEKKYDTVFASNVLNTASSRKMLSDTLDQMHSAVAPGGALVANLPLSPRKSVKVDAKHLMRQLMKRFGDVRRVGGTKKAPLFHATGPK